MAPIIEEPKPSASTENKQENTTSILLHYSVLDYEREGELLLDDLEGEAFLAQLSRYYAEAGGGELALERSALQVQFAAMVNGEATGRRRHCPLKPEIFRRNWKRVLRFAKDNRDCDEFKVELQPDESNG